MYIETGCTKDAGISEGNKHYLTILTLNEEEGVSVSGFKRDDSLNSVEFIENNEIESDLEQRLELIFN